MNKVIVTETDKFIKYSTSNPDFVVSNGYLTGEEIIVPLTANIPKESFALIPVDLVPTSAYFATNSEYAEGGIWDSVQNYGDQDDYSYAFANWSASKRIIPKYVIKDVDKCMYALKDCKGLVDARNLVFHIKNDDPNMIYVCANCINMVYAPRFVFYNAPIVRNYMSMYAGCLNLSKVAIYWGDGSTDPIAERTACQNTFFKCHRLQEIEFQGTGSPIHLDLSYCKELKYSSLLSLGESLATLNMDEVVSKNSEHKVTIDPTVCAVFRGELHTGEEDITVENVPCNAENTEIPDYSTGTQIIPYLDSMERIKELIFDLEIIPQSPQSDSQNFYVNIEKKFGDENAVITTPNALSQRVTMSMTGCSKEELAEGIKLNLVNFNADCSVKVTNIHYLYENGEHTITDKGWSLEEVERADVIIM